MTIRLYKKRYFICLDDNKKKIYVGDTVEVHLSHETHTPHQSIVYWNMLDGAFIESHPAHKRLGSSHRDLGNYINKCNSKCVKVKSFNKFKNI